MMMTYHLKSSSLETRQKNTRLKVVVTFLVIFLIILILNIAPVRNLLFILGTPIWKLENKISSLNTGNFDYLKSKQNLIEENNKLKMLNVSVSSVLFMNDILKKENDDLKALLGRKNLSENTVIASVLVAPPSTPYDTLVLDVGTNDGVKIGNKIIADRNTYIGEVVEVNNTTCKVKLYSSPGEKIPVLLVNNSVHAEAEGFGGGNFEIKLPREVDVKENDPIVLPSISTNIFGVVEKIDIRDKDSFQTILFKNPVNLSELVWVEVVVK